MAKKNISITISTFIASFVISILGYILITQNLEIYNSYVEAMPEHMTLYSKIGENKIELIKNLENIKSVGFRSDPKSLKYKSDLFTINRFDENYFKMQKDFLKSGTFPDNSNELIVSEKTMDKFKFKLGDDIQVQSGDRLLKGNIINPTFGYNKNEKFREDNKMVFKIVGIFKNQSDKKIQNVYSKLTEEKELYPCIKVNRLDKIYDTKLDIEKIVGEKNLVIENINLLRFLKIDETGVHPLSFIGINLLPIIVITVIFIFMIKNVFNIWGIYKIREFSMYKSIGATNFQIYKLLAREIFKISIIPICIGEFLGLVLIVNVFKKLFSLQAKLLSIPTNEIYLNWISILTINFIIFIILMISITFPTRTISKIEILDGLKENIQTKSLKKKRNKNLFKELKINNYKSIRPAFIIMTVGLILVIFLINTSTLNTYNELRNKDERDFNFLLRYSTKNNEYPKIFDDIINEFPTKKTMVTLVKNYYVNTNKLDYSNEFKKIGYAKGFDGLFYYSEDNLVDGTLIGIDNERFSKISENASDVVLVNLVQENPKTFYADAKFIPYIDNNVDSLYLRPLSNMAEQEIEINKKLNTFVEDSENINLYQVCLVTSIENFQKIIKKSEQAFVEKGIEFPRIYYELNMKFSDKNIEEYSKRIEDIMENTVLNDEKYIVNNKIQQMKLNKLNEQSVYFIGVLSIVSVVFLNIANSYASTNLSFFNREKEIGVLLSNGMYVVDLEKNLLKDMKKNIIKSVFIATLIANALFGSLLTTIPYISIKKYISIFPFMIIFLIVLIIISFSYTIYYFAMKKITNKSIVELIR